MTLFASDNFAGTAGQTLQAYSASWVKHPNFTADLVITAGGRARANAASINQVYYHTATPGNADYSVDIDVTNISALANEGEGGAIGRASTTAHTFYLVRFVPFNNAVDLYKVVGGVYTQIVAGVAVTPPANGTSKVLRLDMVGTTIRVLWDGVQRGSVSDSGITAAGNAGIWWGADSTVPTDAAGWHADNFAATDTMQAGAAAATASATLAASASVLASAAAAATADASLAAAGSLLLGAAATPTASGDVSASGVVLLGGASIINATATLAVIGELRGGVPASAVVSISALLTVDSAIAPAVVTYIMGVGRRSRCPVCYGNPQCVVCLGRGWVLLREQTEVRTPSI